MKNYISTLLTSVRIACKLFIWKFKIDTLKLLVYIYTVYYHEHTIGDKMVS